MKHRHRWVRVPLPNLPDAFEKLVTAQWQAELKEFDRTLFGAAPEKASTASNAVLEPHQVCNLETLTEARRQLHMAEADAELDVLLSDDWPIYSAVKRGARHCRVDGRDYLVEVPKTWA